MGTDRIGVGKSSPSTEFFLECDRYSQSIAGNYTRLRLYLRGENGPAGSTGSQFSGAGTQTGSIDGVGTFGTHSANPFLPSGFSQNEVRWHDGPWYVDIDHGADGTRGAVTLRMVLNYGSISNEAFTASFNDFPTIPRASTPSFSPTSPDIGSNVTITTNRASSGFTHDLAYSVNGGSYVSIATGVGASDVWTVPTSLNAQFPNAASGNITIRTITKSGSTTIGTTTKTMTVKVPATIVPDFTTVTHVEAVAGLAANIGAYVQGVSKLALAITGAVGASGSTIKSYKITVAGQTINAASGTTPAPLATAGTYNITGTVTDSRGRTKSKNVSITVKPYAPPVLTAVSVQRALVTGVVDEDEGTYFRVNINAAVQDLTVTTQRNAINYRVSTRVKGTSTYTVKAGPTAPGGITFNSYVLISPYNITDAYDVLVEVFDDFSTSAKLISVPVAAIFMHWDGSDGVGIGKYRQNGALDVMGNIHSTALRLEGTGDASLVSTSHPLQIGATTGVNLILDNNEIIARNNGAANTLSINAEGGNITLGTLASLITILGDVNIAKLPFAVAAGTITSAGSTVASVTFPSGRFDVAPRVFAMFQSGQASVSVCWITGVTATGFDVRAYTLASASASGGIIAWVAVQMTSAAANG